MSATNKSNLNLEHENIWLQLKVKTARRLQGKRERQTLRVPKCARNNREAEKAIPRLKLPQVETPGFLWEEMKCQEMHQTLWAGYVWTKELYNLIVVK